MILVTKPFFVISAHREATFTFDYEHRYSITSSFESGDKLGFIFPDDGINAQVAGEYIYITSGANEGYHKIKEVFAANTYITETEYTVAQSGGELVFIEDHVFKIGIGVDYPANLAAKLPYHEIATFKPEPNLDGQLVVNISGYINSIFDVINSNDNIPVGVLTVYYNLFNRVVLFIDDAIVSEHMAVNASITQYELNRDYVGTGRSLNSGSLGEHYLSCGDTDLMKIDSKTGYVFKSAQYEGAVKVTPSPDFLTGDFLTGDFLTT